MCCLSFRKIFLMPEVSYSPAENESVGKRETNICWKKRLERELDAIGRSNFERQMAEVNGTIRRKKFSGRDADHLQEFQLLNSMQGVCNATRDDAGCARKREVEDLAPKGK